MKHSPYITWAKSRYHIRYNLARSGVPGCDLARLEASVADLEPTGSHENGWGPLLEAIGERYGVSPASVVLAAGCSMANHLALATLLEPGDEVLVEHPTYEPLRLLPAYLRARVVPFSRRAENGYAPDPDALRRLLTPRTRLLVLSDLYNPAGTQLDEAALDGLATLAEHQGIHVLVDEVYLELLYDAGIRTAATRSPWFVTTRSLTKAYGLDGLRAGWVVAEPALAERIRRLNDLFSITTAFPTERLMYRALRRAEALLAPVQALLARNRALVDAFMAAQPRLSWVPPAAGMIGWIRLAGGTVEALIARLEAEHSTTVAPGHFFGVPDHFRLGWGMDTAVLAEGLSRLARALEE